MIRAMDRRLAIVIEGRREDWPVMLAGNWKTSRMVAHYSAGATAERGAVARYLLKQAPAVSPRGAVAVLPRGCVEAHAGPGIEAGRRLVIRNGRAQARSVNLRRRDDGGSRPTGERLRRDWHAQEGPGRSGPGRPPRGRIPMTSRWCLAAALMLSPALSLELVLTHTEGLRQHLVEQGGAQAQLEEHNNWTFDELVQAMFGRHPRRTVH